MKELGLIAVDLGASSGKVCYARFNGSQLCIVEQYSFKHRETELNGNLYWDIFGLYHSIVDGIGYFKEKYGNCDSMAVDTWGASYGLLDKYGRLLEPVFHYRDRRTDQIMEKIFDICPAFELFQLTGCQCNRTYTLPQLVASKNECNVIDNAKNLLMLPDLLSYFLTGSISSEKTIVGTSGLQSFHQDGWGADVIKRFGLPDYIFANVVGTGTIKGRLNRELRSATGAEELHIVSCAGHDSASAVCAIPGFGPDKLYVSIGTNVSIGVEVHEPVGSKMAFECGFKNMPGFGNTKIVYRDFSAMWHLNQMIESFKRRGEEYSIAETINMAMNVQEDFPLFDPEDVWLNTPGEDYCEKLNIYFEQKGNNRIESYGVFARIIFESIAEKIKYYASEFTALGLCFDEAFVVSGGAQNQFLLELIKTRLKCSVYAGLPNGSLIGNLLTQIYALGEAADLVQLRQISGMTSPLQKI